MWLHNRSPHTRRVYLRYVKRFFTWCAKPLHTVTLADLQGWQDTLVNSSPNSQRLAITAVKSLLSFTYSIGITTVNVGMGVRTPPFKDTLNEKYLTEMEVATLIGMEPNLRNQALLLLLYAGGFRVSEICTLTWKDLNTRDDAGQVTVFGKGGRTRTVLLPANVWEKLNQIRGKADDNAPVFSSRQKDINGKGLDPSWVYRIVQKAAKRAGIKKKVSPHWLRHAHASHSLERGAPLHLVQETLGHTNVATTSKYLHARPNTSSSLYLPLS
ncbi:integrase family protein [Crocosphaera watsonii WH 0003]|uniref:Integrase family protein n=3 Tax=Aphanothecaceae TaxID=1890450 RepID=G5JCQ8_CROWT|nr:integrase family protein [Crocosphaera watsonii WH 0003]CCQ56027.1 COG0582: Integrase [Crocosphaera watsonii WH 0005]